MKILILNLFFLFFCSIGMANEINTYKLESLISFENGGCFDSTRLKLKVKKNSFNSQIELVCYGGTVTAQQMENGKHLLGHIIDFSNYEKIELYSNYGAGECKEFQAKIANHFFTAGDPSYNRTGSLNIEVLSSNNVKITLELKSDFSF